ncbi:MAG TPA: hypothetical protein IAA29_07515 [Candidatus Paenibacillus intestinavium]|nr:hypothetical protein [Candidatus Paenibacillus intestinavium]
MSKVVDSESKQQSELERLIQEKVELATKLGLIGVYNPPLNYKDTEAYKRINEIDKRLWELVK